MYHIYSENNRFLNVYAEQFSLLRDNALGFATFIGSRKALEDVRHILTSTSYGPSLQFRYPNSVRNMCFIRPYYGNEHYKFLYRKLGDSTFWMMTVLSVDIYNCCQDLAHGIKMTKNTRVNETRGDSLWNFPIHFLVKGSDLFSSKEEMDAYLAESARSTKREILLNNEYFINVLYQKISMVSRIPLLQEWMKPLLSVRDLYTFMSFDDSGMIPQQEDVMPEDKVFTFKISFYEESLERAIRECFKDGKMSTGSNVAGGIVSQTNTLTGYLNQFGEALVQRAHERFAPLYTPGIDNPNDKAKYFFLNTKYYSNLDYYAAQQDVICAVARGLQQNKRTIVVGECGIGKTSIALASVFVHSQKKNPVVFVMCPGHMVEEWNKEINRLYPFAETHIIENLTELQQFESVIRSKKAPAPLFLIFGKDSCKMNYEERPYLHWNNRYRWYELPNKKQVCVKWKEGSQLEYYAQMINAFLKQNSKNVYADSFVENNQVMYQCIERASANKKSVKLWTATSEDTGEWIKLSKVGWVNKHLAKFFTDLVQTAIARNQDVSTAVLKAYDIASAALGEETAKPLIRCNVSDYVYRRFKNRIDYFIADEVHLYSSKDTAQGKAFTNLVNTARHTLALTGTLLNGYAENIFSMLFKLYSRAFVRNGFTFNDSRDFAKEYGVVEKIEEYDVDPNTDWKTNFKSKTKYKPGVSPLLFSKFLLDKAVFVTLADITADLPNYQEIPLGIDMDRITEAGYRKFVTDFREAVLTHPDTKNKFLFKCIQRMNLYPDQPYNQVPIFNNDTGEQILCPVNIPRTAGKVFASNKDQKLLELIRKHKANGEKVLVYVHWVNRLDCAERIRKMLEAEGIKSAFLTASISARARQKWIAQKLKEGIDVLICNPKLVETGLTLLDFTTIIFYEMDDQLFTLRQASRRSLRLNQSHDVTVYILYFKNTVQENILSLMANKLQAAMAIEGKFSEEGLNAIGDTDSILTQLANNLIKDIDMKLEAGAFDFHTIQAQSSGNRFKGLNHNVMETWMYQINSTPKKQPEKVNIDEELKLLQVS